MSWCQQTVQCEVYWQLHVCRHISRTVYKALVLSWHEMMCESSSRGPKGDGAERQRLEVQLEGSIALEG